MNWGPILSWILLAAVAGATAYSCLALLATSRFLRVCRAVREGRATTFAPPVSLLKPLYGMDRELRSNLESFCRQDYPAYEILFSVRDETDAAVPIVRQLETDFPRLPMRLLFTGPPPYFNAKVHALEVLAETAAHEILVISDSDVRVEPDYLRRVVRPLADPSVGLVTCIAREIPSSGLWSRLEALGINTQYIAGILTAWFLLGMKFALGNTMATRKEQVRLLGGFGRFGNYLADDFVLGEQMAAKGFQVVLSETIPENRLAGEDMQKILAHSVRWERSTRCSRPAGYVGQIFMHNLPLALLAWLAVSPGDSLAGGILVACVGSRLLLAWACASLLLRDPTFRKYGWLLPVQDLVSFGVWLWAFLGREIIWRGARFRVRKGGLLEPVMSRSER